MNEKLIALRLPEDLLDQVDQLVPILGTAGDFQATRVSRSTVARLALLRGLLALQEEFGVDPALAGKPQRRPKAKKRST